MGRNAAGGSHEYAGLSDQTVDLVYSVQRFDALFQKIRMVGLAASMGPANTDEVYAMLHQLAANLVHRPVRIGEQQHGFFRMGQCFQQDIDQPEGGFSRSRGANQHEIVLCLSGTQNQLVEMGALAVH